MAKIVFLRMPDGQVIARILEQNHQYINERMYIADLRTDTECPRCHLDKLEIDDGIVRCQVCGFSLLCIEKDTPLCVNCGSNGLQVERDNSMYCPKCSSRFNFSVYKAYFDQCPLCGKIIHKGSRSGLCPSCQQDFDQEQASNNEENYRTARDIGGFTDDEGRFQWYDEE